VRQRPFGALAGDEKAAEDAGAGCGAGQLFEFATAVEREEIDTVSARPRLRDRN
jgi:hypothetical protein